MLICPMVFYPELRRVSRTCDYPTRMIILPTPFLTGRERSESKDLSASLHTPTNFQQLTNLPLCPQEFCPTAIPFVSVEYELPILQALCFDSYTKCRGGVYESVWQLRCLGNFGEFHGSFVYPAKLWALRCGSATRSVPILRRPATSASDSTRSLPRQTPRLLSRARASGIAASRAALSRFL